MGAVSVKKLWELTTHEFITISAGPITGHEQAMLDAVQAIDSLTNRIESIALYRLCSLLPDGARVLEIGSFNGASAVAMGYSLNKKNGNIYCIDPWSDYVNQDDFAVVEKGRIDDDNRIINSFMSNTAFLGNQVKMMRGLSSDFAGMIAGQNFDLIFIDGAHDYQSVRFDILTCMAALKPGGILTGHDYHSLGHGVRQAVNELVGYVDTIRIKGVIEQTYIWFAKVDQPDYELRLAEISDAYNCGDLSRALNLAMSALQRYKNEELVNIAGMLKSKIFASSREKESISKRLTS